MVKLQRSKGQYFITIPKEYIIKKKWEKGEILTVSFNERGNVEIADVRNKR